MEARKTVLVLVIGVLLLALAGQVAARFEETGGSVDMKKAENYVSSRVQAMPSCIIWNSMMGDFLATGKAPKLLQKFAIRNYTFEKCFPELIGMVPEAPQVGDNEAQAPPAPVKRVYTAERDKKSTERVGKVMRIQPGKYIEGIDDLYIVKAREAVVHDQLKENCKRISVNDLSSLGRGYLDALAPGPRSLKSLYDYCYPELVGKVLEAMGGSVEIDAPTTAGPVNTVQKVITTGTGAATAVASDVCRKYTSRMIALSCLYKSGDKKLLDNCCK